MRLLVDGQPASVEPRPLLLLGVLLERAGDVVTKDELMARVWGGRPTVDNVIANAVAKLRRALADEDGTLIVNVPRVGYCFAGAVHMARPREPAATPSKPAVHASRGRVIAVSALSALLGSVLGWTAHQLLR